MRPMTDHAAAPLDLFNRHEVSLRVTEILRES